MTTKKTHHSRPSSDETSFEPVTIPRFTGRDLPDVSRFLIQFLPPLAIILLIATVLMNPDGVASVISELRTFVTGGFTWLFVVYSLFAVAVSAWVARTRSPNTATSPGTRCCSPAVRASA